MQVQEHLKDDNQTAKTYKHHHEQEKLVQACVDDAGGVASIRTITILMTIRWQNQHPTLRELVKINEVQGFKEKPC